MKMISFDSYHGTESDFLTGGKGKYQSLIESYSDIYPQGGGIVPLKLIMTCLINIEYHTP